MNQKRSKLRFVVFVKEFEKYTLKIATLLVKKSFWFVLSKLLKLSLLIKKE